jgi:hypothetical protein
LCFLHAPAYSLQQARHRPFGHFPPVVRLACQAQALLAVAGCELVAVESVGSARAGGTGMACSRKCFKGDVHILTDVLQHLFAHALVPPASPSASLRLLELTPRVHMIHRLRNLHCAVLCQSYTLADSRLPSSLLLCEPRSMSIPVYRL